MDSRYYNEFWLSMVMILMVVLVLVVIFVAPTLRQQWAIYSAIRRLPTYPDQHWLLGHAPMTLDDFGAAMDWFVDYSVKHGYKIARANYGPFVNSVDLLHPDVAKLGLGSDPKADMDYYPLYRWLGDGLLLSSGRKWGRDRRLLTRAFHFDVLRPYIRVYSEAASVLVEKWSECCDGKSVDISPSIIACTLDVMLRCTCSYESNCQRAHTPYVSAVYELSALAVKRALFFPAYYDWVYALMPDSWRFTKLCNLVHNFSIEIVRKRRAELKQKEARGEDILISFEGKRRKYFDFIDILLQARDDEGCGLTDEEIRAEVDTFMFGGHDTTASGLIWTLYNLARFPEHQEKCRAEVDDIFNEKDDLQWEDLRHLTYLKYCIKESLRLYPPAPSVSRQLSEDKMFGEYKLLKGTSISCFIYAIHRQPDIWDDPEKFDPLRFTPENSSGRHPHAYIPFSAGPRNCIGQEFAMNEQLVILSHILRRFEFSLDESQGPVKIALHFILHPKPGVFLNLTRRNE